MDGCQWWWQRVLDVTFGEVPIGLAIMPSEAPRGASNYARGQEQLKRDEQSDGWGGNDKQLILKQVWIECSNMHQ